MSRSRLTVAEASQRLGVRPQTLYAYVSRGYLRSHRAADGRASLFDADEVEALARRGRPRRSSRQPGLDIVIESAITTIDQGVVRYRGHRQDDLAVHHTFEEVAELLWSGELRPGARWSVSGPVQHRRSGRAPSGRAIDRLLTATVHAAERDPTRNDRTASGVAAAGRTIVGSMVTAAGARGAAPIPRLRLPDRSPRTDTVAGHLWARLSPQRPPSGAVRALNAALVLLADHELAASTLAVRVAASVRADPYAAVTAGLSIVSGPLHGGASRACRRVLRRAEEASSTVAVQEALATYGSVPGFGHVLYERSDPRAVLLLRLLREAWPHDRHWLHVDALVRAAGRRPELFPNVDLALAALGQLGGMPDDGGEAIFAIARTAGWLAHAVEEYAEQPLRYRPRAAPRPTG